MAILEMGGGVPTYVDTQEHLERLGEGPSDVALYMLEQFEADVANPDVYNPITAMASLKDRVPIELPLGRGESSIPIARTRRYYESSQEKWGHTSSDPEAAEKISSERRLQRTGAATTGLAQREDKSGPDDWLNGANCRGVDPELFYPERGASSREAKAVCMSCVVREECLESALQNNEKFGIWGGLSGRERRRILRQRAQAARSVLGA